ncbi:hypothetical protein [Cellulomonas dongxiuzhuiae]|uniref:Uncharacterized protein n=1 Tax=Cellulomonas dongxiuzhuiae TaxID=2819979 RepID=A0ABX8GJR2_9CELL|nr:hypothetical protein [Cellulomonas dongxiuzhuiae]MBO3095140.1 hypothetical protein [Cellulomonas dongxiuzhuiae]QWC16145.1 hypothetical protein KKR89_00200 [Cellulomonas dongxiuzhuiae]
MGILSFLTRKAKPFDREAAQARVRALESVLPAGSQILLMEPEKGFPLTYLVQTVADRSGSSAMLAAAVDVVREGEENWSLDLAVHSGDDDDAPYSTFALPRHALPALDLLRTAHDDLYAAIPTQTISLDASDGSFAISDVAREDALETARVAVRWWEGVLQRSGDRWSASSLTVAVGIGVGADGVHADINYDATIEREPDPLGRHSGPTGSKHVSDAVWAAHVFTAWEDNLPALEVMLGLPVPADHEVDFTFTSDALKPRLTVSHHETYDEDEATAKELVAAIREQVPGSKLKVG